MFGDRSHLQKGNDQDFHVLEEGENYISLQLIDVLDFFS